MPCGIPLTDLEGGSLLSQGVRSGIQARRLWISTQEVLAEQNLAVDDHRSPCGELVGRAAIG